MSFPLQMCVSESERESETERECVFFSRHKNFLMRRTKFQNFFFRFVFLTFKTEEEEESFPFFPFQKCIARWFGFELLGNQQPKSVFPYLFLCTHFLRIYKYFFWNGSNYEDGLSLDELLNLLGMKDLEWLGPVWKKMEIVKILAVGYPV